MRRLLPVFGLLAAASMAWAIDPVPADSSTVTPAPAPVVAPVAPPPTPDSTLARAKPDSAPMRSADTIPAPASPPAATTPAAAAPAATVITPAAVPPPMTDYMKPRRYGDHGPMRNRTPDSASMATVAEPPVVVPVAPAFEPDSVYDEDKALEIKLKTDPEAARRYRSPRKAFFFSLLLPGAGQIYTGAYVRAGLFAAAELGIGIGWYQVAVVSSREKATQAREFAARHWRQERYERRWATLFSDDTSGRTQVRQMSSPQRVSYCASLYGEGESPNRTACSDEPGSTDFKLHLSQFAQGGLKSTDAGAWSQQQVLDFRSANIRNTQDFEDLVGRYQEFLPGWEDNPDTVGFALLEAYAKSVQEFEKDPSVVLVNPWGASAMRDHYLDLRKQSDDLARTQKWFLGAMLANHLASAFDAALQANRMNKRLLHLETTWLDGLNVQGGLAWVGGSPATRGQVDWTF